MNVLINMDIENNIIKNVVLCDFGVSIINKFVSHNILDKTIMNKTNIGVNISYGAPEQLNKSISIYKKTDIYSYGKTLKKLLKEELKD
jgi:hypothetical protein